MFYNFFLVFLTNVLGFTLGVEVLGLIVGGWFSVSAVRLNAAASDDLGHNKTTDFSSCLRCLK